MCDILSKWICSCLFIIAEFDAEKYVWDFEEQIDPIDWTKLLILLLLSSIQSRISAITTELNAAHSSRYIQMKKIHFEWKRDFVNVTSNQLIPLWNKSNNNLRKGTDCTEKLRIFGWKNGLESSDFFFSILQSLNRHVSIETFYARKKKEVEYVSRISLIHSSGKVACVKYLVRQKFIPIKLLIIDFVFSS